MILHATRRQVKSYRNTPRPAGRFGAGLLPPSAPVYRLPIPLSDLAEVAALFAAEWDAETIDEARAMEFETLARIEAGWLL